MLGDITYCVDVVDNASLLVVISECGVTETMLDIIPPPSVQAISCSHFNVTVAPVNVVGNGTALSVIQTFLNEGNNYPISKESGLLLCSTLVRISRG